MSQLFCENFGVMSRRCKSIVGLPPESPVIMGSVFASGGFTAFYEAAPLRYAPFREFVHLSQARRRFCTAAFPACTAKSSYFRNLPEPAPPEYTRRAGRLWTLRVHTDTAMHPDAPMCPDPSEHPDTSKISLPKKRTKAPARSNGRRRTTPCLAPAIHAAVCPRPVAEALRPCAAYLIKLCLPRPCRCGSAA